MKKNIWIVGATVLLLLVGFQVNAQRGRGYGYMDDNGNRTGRMFNEGPGYRDRMQLYLGLSDEQLDQIEELHLNHQKETLPIRNKIREKWAQLHTLISESGDQAQIDKLIDEIGDLRVTIDKQRIRTHFKVRELLTEDQKIKFDASPGFRFMVSDQNQFRHRRWHGLE